MEIRGETITVRQPEITPFSWKRETSLLLPTDENYNDDVQFVFNATTCPLWTLWSSLLGMAGV